MAGALPVSCSPIYQDSANDHTSKMVGNSSVTTGHPQKSCLHAPYKVRGVLEEQGKATDGKWF